MKTQQMKIVLQVGRSKVECISEHPSVGFTKEVKQKLLDSLISRARKMIEAGA